MTSYRLPSITRPAARVVRLAAVCAVAVVALTGCTEDASSGSTEISVTSSGESCELSAVTAPAGSVVFTVKNTSDAESEFYLYQSNGEDIVGEVEEIGPGLSRDLKTDLEAGTYVTACKADSGDEGIRAEFTVTK